MQVVSTLLSVTALKRFVQQASVYSVIDLLLKPHRQIPAMLGDAIIVGSLEKTSNDVCVVSVCPHPSLWDVYSEVLFRPEDCRQRS